jgi:hypothetical protein
MTMSSPWMTSPDPFHSHPTSFYHSVFEDGFFHVLTTGRSESATRGEKWGDQVLIYQDWKYGYLSQVGFNHEQYLVSPVYIG